MTLRQVTYSSPATWTWPGTIDTVEVVLVGGAGAGQYWPNPVVPTSRVTVQGGGGGIRMGIVPVSGPVPIVVGAAGTVIGPTPSTPSPATNPGGSSSFGSFAVDGGAGAGKSAPPIGGGGGQIYPPSGGPAGPTVPNSPGRYGHGYTNGPGPNPLLPTGYAGMGGEFIDGFAVYGGFNQMSAGPATWGYEKKTYGTAFPSSPLNPNPSMPGVVIVKWFE